MAKKIVVINGHPDMESFNKAIAEKYIQGAKDAGFEVKRIDIGSLVFNVNLEKGYKQRQELEPDLQEAWEKISWAEHQVWIHPVWWGGVPAITKGFIDRLFLPGLTFKRRENSILWDKLLNGKTGHIITTLDQPGWYYRMFFGRPSVNQLRKATLQFCGVNPVKVSYVGIIKTSTEVQRTEWLKEIYEMGRIGK